MSSPAPSRYSIAKSTINARPNGVLPVLASTTQRSSLSSTMSSRTALPRLKVVVRRLPPGLTQAEFETAIGDEWKVGAGKVDWAHYNAGKLSKDPAKPSRPARAYMHLTKQEYLSVFSDKIRETTFIDAKGAASDPALLGPPSVEFAPYGRIPHGKVRKDARQGTIDQDPEFIDFLESLTSPTTKPAPPEVTIDSEANKGDDIVVTPLIQYLRDKKANKGKDPGPTVKAIKHTRNDSKDNKISLQPDKKTSPKSAKEAVPSVDKRSATAIKVEKAAREAVKVLNKHAVNSNKIPASSPITPVLPSTPPAAASSPPVIEKRRERGNASVAARILQRDLGIGANSGGRRRRDMPISTGNIGTTSAAVSTKQGTPAVGAASRGLGATNNAIASPLPTQPTKSPMPPVETPVTKLSTSNTNSPPPTGPAASRSLSKPTTPSTNRAPPTPSPNKPVLSSPTSTQAFLKHANPSQGVTESLLQEAFVDFGTINKVEIDKKKGFAYIDFADSEGLQKAIKASPVKVAQGQVVVLERKMGSTLQARNVRGGSMMGGRGSGMPMGPRGGRGAPVRGRGGITRGGPITPMADPTPTTATPASSLSAAAAVPLATSNTIAAPTGPDAPPQPSITTNNPDPQTLSSTLPSREDPSV